MADFPVLMGVCFRLGQVVGTDCEQQYSDVLVQGILDWNLEFYYLNHRQMHRLDIALE